MDLDFALAHGPKKSEGDPECIIFPLDTYQGTSFSDILSSDNRNWSCLSDTRTEWKDEQTEMKVKILI